MSLVEFPRRSFLALLGAGGAAGLGFAAPWSGGASTAALGPTRPPRHSDRLPDLVLRNQRGERVRLYSDLIEDQAVLVSFFYVRCNGSCPATIGVVKRLREALPAEVSSRLRILSITLSPEEDGPADLAGYAEERGLQDAPGLARWDFLTGAAPDIEAIRVAFGYRDPDPEVDKIKSNHAAMVTFGDDARDRWGTLPAGMPFEQLRESMLRKLTSRTRAS